MVGLGTAREQPGPSLPTPKNPPKQSQHTPQKSNPASPESVPFWML